MLGLVSVSLASLLLLYISVSKKGYMLSLGTSKIKVQNIYYYMALFILVFFSGLRIRYNDTKTYIKVFKESSSISFEEFKLVNNPLFKALTFFVRNMTSNVNIYFLLLALVTLGIVFWFMKKYSISLPYSLFYFICIGTYCFTLAAIKQSLAMAVVLVGLPFLIHKKWLIYVLIVFLASMIHTYAIIWLMVPFLNTKPWSYRMIFLVLLTIGVLFTFEDAIAGALEYSSAIGKEIAEFEVFDGNTIHPIRLVVYAFIPVVSLIYRPILEKEYTTLTRILVNLSTISFLILLLGLRNGANLFARMAIYFDIATACILPWVFNKLNFDKKIFKYAFSVALIGYFFYDFGIAKDFSSNYSAISIVEFLNQIF